MNKRLFVIMLATVMMLASCATASTPTHSYLSEQVYWDNGTFASPLFGLRVDLQRGWQPVHPDFRPDNVDLWVIGGNMVGETIRMETIYVGDEFSQLSASDFIKEHIGQYATYEGIVQLGALDWHLFVVYWEDTHLHTSTRYFVNMDDRVVRLVSFFHLASIPLDELMSIFEAY
ncbi:MAG: hypothetical protein FWC76_08315 [Defluviitaleaceae bacterium]|nr:hypothetical protein [Defluviitaleaceae bacterium]